MKRRTNSNVVNLYLNDFNFIANYIEKKTKIDVRKDTESRKYKLPMFRCLFFNIALKCTKADYATIGAFLNKDHATVVHAKKMWDNDVKNFLGEYLIDFIEVKEPSKLTGTDLILSYELKVKSLQDRIVDLTLQNEHQKDNISSNIRNNNLKKLLEMDEDIIDIFIKTRLEPFLKMNNLKKIVANS